MKLKPNSAAQADNDGVIEAPCITRHFPPRCRRRVSIAFDPAEDRTQQSFKNDCDINQIMARYLRTGQLPQSNREPVYLDTTAYDFQEAADLVARARGEFSLLPAEERDSFGNSVELWLDHKAAEAAQEAADAAEAAAAAKVALAAPTQSVEAPAKGEPTAPATAPAKPGKGLRANFLLDVIGPTDTKSRFRVVSGGSGGVPLS